MTKQKLTQISPNLPDNRFVLLRKFEKKPKERNWPTIKPLSKQQAHTHLKANNNIGLLLGKDYVAIDCDSLELELAVEQLINIPTYTQKSANRGFKHFIYKVKGFDENLGLANGQPEYLSKGVKNPNYKLYGEILCSGKQLVVYPSKIKKKDGTIGEYEVLEDLEIAEISKSQLLSVILQFHSRLTKQVETENKQFLGSGDVDSLNILDVIDTSQLKINSKGQYHGSNVWHGSETGDNFYVDPNKNLAYCFRGSCDCAISPIKAVALNEGIINSCSSVLRGSDFLKAKEIAIAKHHLRPTEHYEQPQLNNQSIENKGLGIIPATELLKSKVKTKPIIKGLVYEKETTQITGLTYNYKSLWAMYEAVCISRGLKLLGKFPTQQLNVLMLSAENNRLTDQNRLKSILKGMNIRKPKNLFFLTRDKCGIDLLDSKTQLALKHDIVKNNIKVLYLDVANSFFENLDDNKAQDVERAFKHFFFPFIDKFGLTIRYLFHTDKSGKRYLGSVKWKSKADNEWFIVRVKENSNEIFISNEKTRVAPFETMKVRINTVKDSDGMFSKTNFELLEQTGIGRTKKRKKTKKQLAKEIILSALDKKKPTHYSKLKELVTKKDISESTFKSQALKELEAKQEIIYKDGGYLLK